MEKNRSIKQKMFRESEREAFNMYPPLAFNKEVDFGQKGLENKRPVLSNASKCTGLKCECSLHLQQAATC